MTRSFGGHIRRSRERLRQADATFSVRQVAQRIGVEPSFLSKVERDAAPPAFDQTARARSQSASVFFDVSFMATIYQTTLIRLPTVSPKSELSSAMGVSFVNPKSAFRQFSSAFEGGPGVDSVWPGRLLFTHSRHGARHLGRPI